MMASSSAINTRVGNAGSPSWFGCMWSGGLGGRAGDQAVEQLVLRALERLELGDDVRAVPAHRVGVLLGLAVLLLGERCLGDQGPDAGVVGLVGEVRELLLGHAQLLAEVAQAVGHLGEATLDQGT